MQCCPNKLIYIKTNFFLHLVRNMSIISTLLRQELKIQGFFLSLEDGKEHIWNKPTLNRKLSMKCFLKRLIYIKTNFFIYLIECNVIRINVFTLKPCLNIVIRNGKTSFWFFWLWSQELFLRLNEKLTKYNFLSLIG